MWIEITRGVAALKSVWGFGSTVAADETGTMASPLPDGDYLADAESYIHMGRHQSAAILAGENLRSPLRL